MRLPDPRWTRRHTLARLALMWACVALVYLGFAEWRLWWQADAIQVTAATAGTGLLAGLAGLLMVQLLAMLVFGFATRGWHLPEVANARPSRTELALVALVTIVALALRLAGLQDIPAGLWYDTAENGNQALRMLQADNYRPVFIGEATQLPALFVYFDAFSINLFGAEAFAVRLPSVLFGAATVPALWWLGRQLGGPALGVAAAFALAASRWHIDFSRLGLASIVTPFALTVALAAALAALRAKSENRRIALSILAGLAISLGLWSYPASILTIPAVAGGIACWVARGLKSSWRSRLRRAALVLGVVAISCIVSLEPLIEWTFNNPDSVLQRPQAVAVSGDAGSTLVQSSIQHVLMFTVRGDRNGRHNTPGRPELGWYAPLFLAGVGAALLRAGSGLSLALPAALLFLVGGIATLPFEAPQSHRAILAVVPASILIAVPVALLWVRNRLLALPVLGVLLVAGAVEASDYFQAQLKESPVYMENSLLETDAGRWLHTLGTNIPVLASERFRTHPTVRFLSGEHPSVATAGTAITEFLPLDGSQPVAIISSSDEPAVLQRARTLYAQVAVQTFGPPQPTGDVLLSAVFIPRELQQQTRGFEAERSDGTRLTVAAVGDGDARAWTATMRLFVSGEYRVDATGSTVAIDDQAVPVPAELFLARGPHAIRVTRSDDSAAAPRMNLVLARQAPGLPGSPQLASVDPLFFALPPPGGLLFTWEIEGRPPQALVDSAPHREFEGTFNDGRPWTAQWAGTIRLQDPGEYAFRMEAVSSAMLFIDERPLLRSGTEMHVPLAAGVHAFRVAYTDRDPYARLFLDWRPPGQTEFSAIPDNVLTPALRSP